jgi:hypothetical protein
MRFNRLLNDIKERFNSFMIGRNGFDPLCKLLLYIAAIVFVVNIFLETLYFACVSLILVGYAIFRIFSRNIYQRKKECDAYLNFIKRFKNYFALKRVKWRDRKTHVFRKCPKCKNVLRLPKKKGKHTVNCPACRNKFDIKI